MSGPLHSDPPCQIARTYTTTLAISSASVTNGNRSVGMLSLIGNKRQLDRRRSRGGGDPARAAASVAGPGKLGLRERSAAAVDRQGCSGGPSSANVQCSVKLTSRDRLPETTKVVARSST